MTQTNKKMPSLLQYPVGLLDVKEEDRNVKNTSTIFLAIWNSLCNFAKNINHGSKQHYCCFCVLK